MNRRTLLTAAVVALALAGFLLVDRAGPPGPPPPAPGPDGPPVTVVAGRETKCRIPR